MRRPEDKPQKRRSKSTTTLQGLVAATAAQHPGQPAILAPGRTPLNYAALKNQIDQTVTRLQSAGIRPGDRLGVVLPNGPEMAVAFLAVGSAATCAPLNPAYREEEFHFYLNDLQARALIVQRSDETPARAAAASLNIPVFELEPDESGAAGTFTLNCAGTAGNEAARLATSDDIALVLHTSGTTSRPKIVPLSHANLCHSARNVAAALQLGPADRCLNVMPLFHIHGLVGATLSTLAAGASIVCTPGFFAPRFFEWMQEMRPTWYSAVPTMHQAILARAEAHREVIEEIPLRLIRSSSAALPPQVMEALEDAFNAPVIESYGMTEAAHQMASNPLPPGERIPGSVGVAAGPEVQIMSAEGILLGAGKTGEVVIRGPNVTAGYDRNEAANADAFTNGWFRTGDQGYLDENGYLFLTGRLKEIINRGGEKISPREIDEVLLNHPDIVQVVTFAMPDDRLGEEIAVAVILRDGATADEQAIRAFAAESLADFKVPKSVVILDEIPKGPTGKLQRIGLAEKLGLDGQSAEVSEPDRKPCTPRTPLESALAGIWSGILNSDIQNIHASFLDLGGDSVLATQFATRLRERYAYELPMVAFFERPTIAAVAQTLRLHLAASPDEAAAAALLDEVESLSEAEADELLADMQH